MSAPLRRNLDTPPVAGPNRGTLTRVADLDFWTDRGPLVDPSGEMLYLFGFDMADPRGWVVKGDPFVAVPDASTGHARARVPLAGVGVGRRLEQRQGERFYAIYGPAVVLAPDGSRMYVVHAESERVSAVDLRTLTPAAPIELARRPSPAARPRDSCSTASRRRPSSRTEVWPQGLVVLNPHTMRVEHRKEGIGQFVLSPDGKRLYGIGWDFSHDHQHGLGYMIPSGTGLKVLDATELRLEAHVTPDVAYQALALSPDGRYLYLLSQGPGSSEAGMNQGRCRQPCRLLTVVETAAPRVAAERPLFTYMVEFATAHPWR